MTLGTCDGMLLTIGDLNMTYGTYILELDDMDMILGVL